MGAGASIPDQIDKDTFIKLAAGKYDTKLFELYADTNGHLTKEKLLLLMHQTDIYFSYAVGLDSKGRDIQERVKKLNEGLKTKSLVTSFDSDRSKNLTKESIKQGIDHTRVVIVFFTKAYLEKINSKSKKNHEKFEFSYAIRTKGFNQKLIPIILDKECVDRSTWLGSIGFAFEGISSIEYSEEDQLESVIQQIYETICKITIPMLSDHPTLPSQRPKIPHPSVVLSDKIVDCITCEKGLIPFPPNTWGNGWTCDWPTHEGKNGYHTNDIVYGCEECMFGICQACHDRIIIGQDTYMKNSLVTCKICEVGVFRYPSSFVEELGGQWNCDCHLHPGDALLSSEDAYYGCPTVSDCQYGICESCFHRVAMGGGGTATLRADEEEDDGSGIILFRGRIDDDEEPIFD